MGIVGEGGGDLRNAPNLECRRETFILLDVTHDADPHEYRYIHLRGGSAVHDGSAASNLPPPRHASVKNCSFVRDI